MPDETPPMIELRLADRREVTHDLLFVRFEPGGEVTFHPGQYTALTIGGQSSYFSIASAPGEATLDFFVRVYEAKRETPGAFLERLWNLPVGGAAHVPVRGLGRFGLDLNFKSHVMIATTTGITPLRSMLRAWRAGYYGARAPRRAALLYGVSYADELFFDGEFRAMAAEGALDYMPTVSRADDPRRNAGWTGRHGRVHICALEELTRLGYPPGETVVYLCGNAGMIADLCGRDVRDGAPQGRLLEAGYEVRTQF